jgi:hypothetical protein
MSKLSKSEQEYYDQKGQKDGNEGKYNTPLRSVLGLAFGNSDENWERHEIYKKGYENGRKQRK